QDHSDVRGILPPRAGFVECRRYRAGGFQNRQSQSHQSSLPFMTVDGHSGGISVEDLQTFSDIGHSDAAAAQASWTFKELGGAHTNAVILNFHDKGRVGDMTAEENAAALHLGRQPVLD